MAPLPWGSRFLMCPPEHFGVRYEINPWMRDQVAVDPDLAREQWEGLRAAIEDAGAEVLVMEPHPEVPDLVFTANAGIVSGRRFVPSHFRFPERQPETAIYADWFEAEGYEVYRLPETTDHEGAGDAVGVPRGDAPPVLVSAHSFRSDADATPLLADLLGCEVVPIRLVDERLYHLDLTLCPLDDRHALCAPSGWDAAGRAAAAALVPEPLWLEEEEALAFCVNSVVVGTTVLMPSVPPRVGRQLEAWGFTPVEVQVGEFLKAGGGCRCLTLALDVDLRAPASAAG